MCSYSSNSLQQVQVGATGSMGKKRLCPISGKSLENCSLKSDLNCSFSAFALSLEFDINLRSTLGGPTPEEYFLMSINWTRVSSLIFSRFGSIRSYI